MSESDQIIELERRLEEAINENDALRAQISTAGTDCGIWERDFVTGEVYRSERLLEIMGYRPGDPLPGVERIDDAIHPDDFERRQIAMDRHFDFRTPFDEEFRIRRSMGEYIWVHARGQATWDENGKAVRWAGSISEITERKQIEEALQESEQRYRGLIESSGLGIHIAKVGGGRLFMNATLVRLLGYESPQEVYDLPNYRLVASHDQEKAIGYLKAAAEFPDGYSQQYECDYVHKNGEILSFHVIIRKIVWYGEAGIERTLIDISERREAELALLESEERLRAIIDHSPSLIFLKDTESRLLLVNKAYEERFGISREEVLGKQSYGWLGSELIEQIIAQDQEVIARAGPVVLEIEHTDSAGRSHFVQSIKFPVRDPAGNIIGLGGISSDITELKKVEQDLRESQLKAEAANRLKSEFLATMSHEIRTPMHGILGTVSLIQDTDLSPAQRNYADTIKQSGDALLNIINSILDLSKIEAGGLLIEEVDFGLAPLLDSVAGLMESRARHKGLAFAIERAPNVSDSLRGDPDRIRQILFNLIGNSIKFTEAGGIAIRVSQTIRADEICEIRFEVEDTGIGLDEEQQERVFDRFSQADGSTTRKFGGTGLGLAISRELAQLMGGSIGVRSYPGGGSVFWFTVRCEAGDAANIHEQDQSRNSDGPAEAMQIQSLRILIAEDNLVNQLIASDTLESAGHRVDVVSNGVEAIEAVTAFPYDLILMDIFMPEMDGLTATKRIRAMPGEVSNIPIIALTADAMAGEREKYLAAGMNDYLSKPFEMQQLLRTIKRCIFHGTPATH